MATGALLADEPVKGAGLWLVAQTVALLATLLVIAGLFVEPDLTLTYLWGLIIPIVPASLLISPMLWRNVCPLATLNKLPSGHSGTAVLGPQGLSRLALLGMVLLFVLVTARHVLFNGFNASDGTVLGVVVVLVAVAALVLGLRFQAKSGFCNSFCPVLPVERLYGQSPLLQANNPRCPECVQCTYTGCIDLGPEVSIPQVVGKARSSARWVLTAYGSFAAAFPGFVLGYFLAPDGALETAPAVFLVVGQWTLASWAAVAIVVAATRAPSRRVMPVLGAAAAGIYYWFSGPILSRTLALDGQPVWGTGTSLAANAFRAAAFLLIATWLVIALRRDRRRALREPARARQ